MVFIAGMIHSLSYPMGPRRGPSRTHSLERMEGFLSSPPPPPPPLSITTNLHPPTAPSGGHSSADRRTPRNTFTANFAGGHGGREGLTGFGFNGKKYSQVKRRSIIGLDVGKCSGNYDRVVRAAPLMRLIASCGDALIMITGPNFELIFHALAPAVAILPVCHSRRVTQTINQTITPYEWYATSTMCRVIIQMVFDKEPPVNE